MKPHYKTLATILAATLQLAAIAAVPLAWDVRPGQPAPVTFDRYHGETLEFSATFRGFGALPFAGDADIRLWYQVNGMGASWWSAPATVQSNVLSATWSPTFDPGADRVSLFFGAPSNAYAAAVLRLRHSPGFSPANPPPPSTFTESDPVFTAWLADFSPTNHTHATLTDGTNTITATRDVYEWTQTGYTDWVPTIQEVVQGEYVYKPVNYAPPKYFGTAEELFEDDYYTTYSNWSGPGWYYMYEIDRNGEYFTTAGDYCSAPSNALELASSYFGFVRAREYETVNKGKLALTNDIPNVSMDVSRTTDTSVLLNDPALPSARLVPDETPSAYWPNRQRVLRLGDRDSVISMDRTETKLLLVDDPAHLVFVESATVDGNGNTNYTLKTFRQYLDAVSPDTLQQTLRSYLPTEGGGSVTGNVEIVGDVLVSGTLAAPHLLRVVTADIEANGFSVSNGVLRANSGLMVSNGMCRINCARAVLGIGTPRLHMETVDPLSHITFGGTWDEPFGNLETAVNMKVRTGIANAFPTFEQAQSYAYLPTNTPPFTTANQLSQDVVSHTPPVGLVTLRNWRTNILTDSQYNAYVVLQLDPNELPLDTFECDILFRYTSAVPSFYFHFSTFGESPTFYGQTDAFSPTAGTVRLVHMKHIGNDEWIVTCQDLTSWSPPMNMTFTEEP